MWNSFLKGENKAFGDLFETFSDSMFDYGSRLTLDKKLVEDCIQDLFIKLYNNRNRLPQVHNIRFYLFKSLKNAILNSAAKNRSIDLSSPDLPFYMEYRFMGEPEGELSVPAETWEKLLSELNKLTGRQKEALYLRYQRDMDYDEISQLLDMKYQSTRNLIHRTIKKLRTEMDVETDIKLLLVLLFSNLQ